MLVLSYLRQDLSYKLLLVTLFYTDGIWWLANSLSSSELSEPTEDLALAIFFCVSDFFLAFAFFKTSASKHILPLLAIVPVALLISPFYYTPLALALAPIFSAQTRATTPQSA
jgi:hypothetical protein